MFLTRKFITVPIFITVQVIFFLFNLQKLDPVQNQPSSKNPDSSHHLKAKQQIGERWGEEFQEERGKVFGSRPLRHGNPLRLSINSILPLASSLSLRRGIKSIISISSCPEPNLPFSFHFLLALGHSIAFYFVLNLHFCSY